MLDQSKAKNRKKKKETLFIGLLIGEFCRAGVMHSQILRVLRFYEYFE